MFQSKLLENTLHLNFLLCLLHLNAFIYKSIAGKSSSIDALSMFIRFHSLLFQPTKHTDFCLYVYRNVGVGPSTTT